MCGGVVLAAATPWPALKLQAKGRIDVTSLSEPPIRVFHDDEYWRVDYGSYIGGFHATRAEAVATATEAATREQRKLEIEATD